MPVQPLSLLADASMYIFLEFCVHVNSENLTSDLDLEVEVTSIRTPPRCLVRAAIIFKSFFLELLCS